MTYPMAFHTPGGGEIQLLKYQKSIKERGHTVDLFNMWQPDFENYDLIHYFSCYGGSEPFCRFVKEINIPLVISTSLWLNNDTRKQYDLHTIKQQLEQSDKLITNSHIESNQISQILDIPLHKFSCVYNAVDKDFINTYTRDTAKSAWVNQPTPPPRP